MKQKIRVAVLYGGKSGEHEVSQNSAFSVINALDKERFAVTPIGIDKEGNWLLNELPKVLNHQEKFIVVTDNTSLPITVPQVKEIQNGVNKSTFDVIFPVMHGPLYEDGTLQGVLRLAEIPFVGSGVLSSAIAMDKAVAKQLIAANGLPTVPGIAISRGKWQKDQASVLKDLASFGYPLFVKPVNLGSSVGISKVKTPEELIPAITEAFHFDKKILIEKGLNVREIELSVLENRADETDPLVSIPGEIEVTNHHEFYSYDAKYLDPNGALLKIPAPLPEEKVKEAKAIAKQAFLILQCEGMARVDLFLDKTSNQFYFNEVNTLPGFTSISMYPKLWEASGLPYKELLSLLIDLALARHGKEMKIKRDFTS